MLRKLEDILDKNTPILEVKDYININANKFLDIINDFITKNNYKIREKSSDYIIINIPGKTLINNLNLKKLSGHNLDKYNNVKSKIRCNIQNKNSIEIISYEHILCLENEKIIFLEILENRLKIFKNFIEQNLK